MNDKNTFNSSAERTIILDFSHCRYAGEIHCVLKSELGLPEYYGENWSALWDCLHGRFLGIGRYHIEIYGFYSLKDELREYCLPMTEIFKDVHNDTPNVTFEIIN